MGEKPKREIGTDARITETKTYYGGKLTEAKIQAVKMGPMNPPETPKPSTHGKKSTSRK